MDFLGLTNRNDMQVRNKLMKCFGAAYFVLTYVSLFWVSTFDFKASFTLIVSIQRSPSSLDPPVSFQMKVGLSKSR